jgi:hypothetical protein
MTKIKKKPRYLQSRSKTYGRLKTPITHWNYNYPYLHIFSLSIIHSISTLIVILPPS